MAVRYYYFQAEAFDLSFVQSRVPAAAGTVQIAPSPGGTSFLIVQADDVFQGDLLAAMGDEGFTLIFSSLVVPTAFGQARFYGSIAADPVSPPFPAPAAGDFYWNTTSLTFRAYNGVAWVGLVGSDTSVLGFGAGQVLNTTTTRFLYPWWDNTLAQTIAVQIRAPRAGTIRNLRVRQNVTAGNGNAIVYTLRVNSVATALTVSMASTAADGSDLVNSVVVAAGDLLDIVVTKAADVVTSPSDIAATAEFV